MKNPYKEFQNPIMHGLDKQKDAQPETNMPWQLLQS